MAQSVKRPASAQVMISWFVDSSPVLGSVLTAQRLEPVSDSASPSLSAPPPLMVCLSLKNKQTLKKKKLSCGQMDLYLFQMYKSSGLDSGFFFFYFSAGTRWKAWPSANFKYLKSGGTRTSSCNHQ